jgi:uncharacterized membrane protein YfcA
VTAAFLLGAGVIAGVIGTAGGITSLVAYPALLAVGVPPLTANVTNSVALLGSGLGGSLRAGPDLAGHARTLRVWMAPVVVLSLAGAVLLIVTPGDTFNRVVPFLVAGGSLVLMLQPVLARVRLRPEVVGVAGAGVAVYNGYFGAGSGILLMALLLLTTEPVLHRANSLKNVILIASDVLPAVLFTVRGAVAWWAAWPLALGALGGGLIGPAIARRVAPGLMRALIGACGFGLAIWLFARYSGGG